MVKPTRTAGHPDQPPGEALPDGGGDVPLVFFDQVGYADVQAGACILTLCAAFWTPRDASGSQSALDARVVARLRFTPQTLLHLRDIINAMVLAISTPEGTKAN